MPEPKNVTDRRVPVMVEMGVDQDSTPETILRAAEEWRSMGFAVDLKYPPVRIRPPREQRDRLEAARIKVVIVRGLLLPEQIRALEAHGQVRKVWLDTRIEPFVRAKPRPRKRRPRSRPAKVKGRRRPLLRRRTTRRPVVTPDCETNTTGVGDLDPGVVKYLKVDRIRSAGFRGNGIVVAMVDGGITAIGRPIKAGEMAKIANVVDGWPDADWGTTAEGWDQHGNMTAHDVLGIAPGVKLWDIRIWQAVTGNLATDFTGLVSNAIAGYRKAIDTHTATGAPHILSNSWGLYNRNNGLDYATNPQSPFALMVEEALDEGILVLFAAGNCGGGCQFSQNSRCGPNDRGPGNSILGPNGHPRVMTVGAANKKGRWCGYTSQGPAVLPPNAPKPDFCSIAHFDGYFPTHPFPNPSGNPARDFDGGTSAATAVAAGVVALLMEGKRSTGGSLSQDEAKTALMDTAKDIRRVGSDRDSGAGIIQAKAAFDTL